MTKDEQIAALHDLYNEWAATSLTAPAAMLRLKNILAAAPAQPSNDTALRTALKKIQNGAENPHISDHEYRKLAPQCASGALAAAPAQPQSENIKLHAKLRGIKARIVWRPIETALKDGSPMLLAKIVGHPDHPTALWWVAKGHWSSRWNNWNDGVEPSGLADPTHWMPAFPLLMVADCTDEVTADDIRAGADE